VAGVSGRDHWPDGFDVHLLPDDDRLKVISAAHADAPSLDERRRLRTLLGGELLKKLHGTAAGRAVAEVTTATRHEIPWTTVLAQFVAGVRRTDYQLFPFNRKHLWRGLCLPSVGKPGPEHLITAVDTSGSMSLDDLAAIAAELDALRSVSECTVTALQFDVTVTHVEVFEPYQQTQLTSRCRFVGRGGTDIRAPFTWVESGLRTGHLPQPPDAMIVLTDGFGPMPSPPPSWPVLWIGTQHSIGTFPFGAVARISSHLHHRGRQCR
jgi:predicted metal-dependent peptidase